MSYFEDTLDERIELSLEALDINGNVTARELQKQFASAMCVSGDDIQVGDLHVTIARKDFDHLKNVPLVVYGYLIVKDESVKE